MKKALRSNFEQWNALGLTGEDLLKPKIAVVNSSSELAAGCSQLDGIARIIKEAVRGAGGLPFEVRTAVAGDIFTGTGYHLASRDLIVNDMEIAIEGARLDGMICLSSGNTTPAAHLMAAGRFNVPAILVMCGYQPGDARMGTANSMHIVCEALGMALPGSAPILANSPRMFDYCRRAGRRIVEMVWDDLKPRDILTPGSFENAAAAMLAVSGSINCIKHLQATAIEAGVDVDVFQLFNDLGDEVPVLSAVAPNGTDTIEAFEAAGGAKALMLQLESLLDRSAVTVTGKTVGDNLADAEVFDEEVIRPIDRPFSNKPPIVVLHGSLAPESAIVKLGVRGPDRKTQFIGAASVYENGPDAIDAIQRGDVKPGHVLVVRGMGPKGGPGMAGPASRVVFAIDAAGLSDEVAFVSDGQLSGLCVKGIMVAEVSPESAIGGPLSLVENGDTIRIDVDARVLDINVSDVDLASRRARKGEPVLPASKGYLSIYQRTVQPMSTGAVLIEQT